jgi:transposase
MKPISTDLRTRIVEIYREGQLSYPKVAERFRVSESSVKNFVKQWRATGTLEPKPAANGKTCVIDAAGEDVLRGLIEKKTNWSHIELRDAFAAETGCSVSQPTISRVLQRVGITRKKSRSGPKSKAEMTSNRPGRRFRRSNRRSGETI